MHYVIEFDGPKLIGGTPTIETTESATIPAGTYDVILGSRDDVRGRQQQDNERWRAKFGDATTGFSDDLDDGPPLVENVSNVTHLTQPVILAVAVTEVVAQHWSVVHDDDTVSDKTCIRIMCASSKPGETRLTKASCYRPPTSVVP